MSRQLHLILLLLFVIKAGGQEYNYIHYDTKDGLAGSTVYRICQDKKGYIWFATDNGVSRFDGKRFKNFTTEDGLTDNEVLHIGSDSVGRVWMTPFNKTICYYYEGKIHNSSNDAALRMPDVKGYVAMSGERQNEEAYLSTYEGVFLYTPSGTIKKIADFKTLADQYGLNPFEFLPFQGGKVYPHHLLLYNKNKVFGEQNGKFVLLKTLRNNIGKFIAWIDNELEPVPLKYPPPDFFLSIAFSGDSLLLYSTPNGCWIINRDGVIGKKPFLPDKRISNALLDNEGNLWFSTLGEGVYRLTSKSMKTFASDQEFFCIGKTSDKLYAGAANGNTYTIKNFTLEKEERFHQLANKNQFTRLYTLKIDSPETIYFGYDAYLTKTDHGKKILSFLRPIKSIDIVDKDHIVVCTNFYTLKLNSHDLKVVDTLWRERGTKVIYEKGKYYIGTLNGLVIVDQQNRVTKAGEHDSLLSKRVVDIIKNNDGSLWIATNDNGVLLFKNGKVDTVINIHNGLSSNICKSLFLKDNYLWVGTNKGLNKIETVTKKVLTHYSTSDGLASDVINAVYAEDSIVWIGSPGGLTYFNENEIQSNSICNLDLNNIHVSGKEIDPHHLSLSYKNDNISFDYTAISFKAAGEVTYWYKLGGLDKNWKETKLTTLNYPSLPPGDYNFELYAVNKFGKKSNIVQIPFSIAAPVWKTFWFWLSVVVIMVITAWLLLRRRYRILRKQLEEKNLITRRIAELEQTSLRAQMNPHFIFNCLSSIQHFILKKDFEFANRYITRFANLIRQTLDNSSKSSISIEDEINYLTNYLELEQMRFTSKFEYDIEIDGRIDRQCTFIPPMVLQPFVENAIRHGIRYKKDGTGFIKISIRQLERSILFSVEDNGVGRETAAKYKTGQHIEYQSKGITLTRDRLAILTSESDEKIKTTINDLVDDKGKVAGTQVMISFPMGIIDKLN